MERRSDGREGSAEKGRRWSSLIFLAWFLFGMGVSASTAIAVAPIGVECPETVHIGEPFRLRVRLPAVSKPKTLRVAWLGISLDVELRCRGGDCEGEILLGTEVGKAKPGTQTLRLVADVEGEKVVLQRKIAVRAKHYPETRLSLPEKMVTPPKDVLERIAREREQVLKARKTFTARRYWTLPLQRPVPGVVTSPYGGRRILNDKPRAPHGGVDFRAASGTPVKAAVEGMVILTGEHYYAGKSVYIDSGNGMISLYMHLSEIAVKEGDLVRRGQVLGKSGMTGRATGPHLHFGLCLGGQLVDPQSLFDER
ncbi:M23 family metallopeptidase [Aminiphilus circumscriptus]|jgi:biotin carboxyl carrier protein|uniref:M23 family metallopeptidase n=1 Tax=Aminiphilus circumscriptus TaxID=290732 RepID=UPI000492E432|nr:M23 family metallopeptidase [Aminiphilus circumscriptus]